MTSTAPQDVPGFAAAVTEAHRGTVRVHLIGRLDAATVRILTAALPSRHERPGEKDVVLDLTALAFVADGDESPRGEPGAAGRRGPGGQFRASARGGSSPAGLRSLGGLKGSAPPHLECTDILHWKPRLLAQERPSR